MNVVGMKLNDAGRGTVLGQPCWQIGDILNFPEKWSCIKSEKINCDVIMVLFLNTVLGVR